MILLRCGGGFPERSTVRSECVQHHASGKSQSPYSTGLVTGHRIMHFRYKLVWDAEEHQGGFVPRVLITDLETQRPALRWRATYSLDTMSGALLYARQYGESALTALNSLDGQAAADSPPED